MLAGPYVSGWRGLEEGLCSLVKPAVVVHIHFGSGASEIQICESRQMCIMTMGLHTLIEPLNRDGFVFKKGTLTGPVAIEAEVGLSSTDSPNPSLTKVEGRWAGSHNRPRLSLCIYHLMAYILISTQIRLVS